MAPSSRGEKGALMSGKHFSKKLCDLQAESDENSRCFVCDDPAPRYVCATFKTFVCQGCADVHCEYGHHIKSVLHSEWDVEAYSEVAKGGNRAAAEHWLAFWNPDDYPRPDRDDVARVKDWIRKAFVIKCWQRQPKRPSRKCSLDAEPAAAADNGQAFANFEVNWDNLPPPPALDAPAPAPDRAVINAELRADEREEQAYVPLSIVEAVYCSDHDSSLKRAKGEPQEHVCQGCNLPLRTNYVNLAFCPRCSSECSRCLVCGVAIPPHKPARPAAAAAQPPPAAETAEPDAATREGTCVSREGSDAHSTEAPPTSVATDGEGEFGWKADFSSDGEGLSEPGPLAVELPRTEPAPVAAASVPAVTAAPPAAAAGSLMDLDVHLPAAAAAASTSAMQDLLGDLVEVAGGAGCDAQAVPVPAEVPAEAVPVPAEVPAEAAPVPAEVPVEAVPVPAEVPAEAVPVPAEVLEQPCAAQVLLEQPCAADSTLGDSSGPPPGAAASPQPPAGTAASAAAAAGPGAGGSSSSSFMPDDWLREQASVAADAFDDVLNAFHQKAWW